MVEIRALSESSSSEAVAKVAGAHTRPHFIGKVRYEESTREEEKKTSREYKRRGEKTAIEYKKKGENIKRVQTMDK